MVAQPPARWSRQNWYSPQQAVSRAFHYLRQRCWSPLACAKDRYCPAPFADYWHSFCYMYKKLLRFFFFYKNVEAEFNQHFKNMLRRYPGESGKNVFILLICFCRVANFCVQCYLLRVGCRDIFFTCSRHHRKLPKQKSFDKQLNTTSQQTIPCT